MVAYADDWTALVRGMEAVGEFTRIISRFLQANHMAADADKSFLYVKGCLQTPPMVLTTGGLREISVKNGEPVKLLGKAPRKVLCPTRPARP